MRDRRLALRVCDERSQTVSRPIRTACPGGRGSALRRCAPGSRRPRCEKSVESVPTSSADREWFRAMTFSCVPSAEYLDGFGEIGKAHRLSEERIHALV